MNTQKATYWFAVALAAVAFHSEYQKGAFPALHRAANSAGATVCQLTSKAERTLAMARLVVTKPTFSSGEALARLEAQQLADARQIARESAEMAREQARGRSEELREQIRARAEMGRAEREMRHSQMRDLRLFSQSQVRISNAVDLPMIQVRPGRCSKAEIRVEVPSIDLHMDDSADDDADSQ